MTEPPAEEFSGVARRLPKGQARLVGWLCAGFTAFHLIVLNLFPLDPWIFRSVHVSWGAVLALALYRPWRGERSPGVPWYDLLLMAGAIACSVYIAVELADIQFRAGAIPTMGDMALGTFGTLLVLEIARRTAGPALPIIAGLFILYAFAGPWLPGVLYHRGYDWEFLFPYLYSDQGILGPTVAVSSTYIVLFVAFGAFLQVSRVGDYFNDLCLGLFGWARGGPAKATVVSGVLFGSISGSAVANVVASGAITIPMMKKVGYDRATAGAIEATSSTGGQITPPVLGAGAFIMAEITGIPYGEIALAAVIPCLLFYVACLAHVDLHARVNGLAGLPRSQLPAVADLLRKAYLFLPLAVLIGLLTTGASAFRAGTLAIVAAVVVSWLDRRAAMGPRAVVEALDKGARDAVQLVAVCACAGIIVGVIALTGVGGRVSTLILGLADGSQVLALLFAMLVSMVLGMGMPTTAAYAIAASVVAPGLQRLGIEPLVAHMFIFYYAVLSAITPPVALASFAAAGIAQADPWRTSFKALKIGLATFVVPFMFFASPALLGQGTAWEIAPVLATALAGVLLLACATEGWFGGRLTGWALRLPLAAAALLLIVPEPVTDAVGLGTALLVFLLRRRFAASA